MEGSIKKYYGKRISKALFDKANNNIQLTFDDGVTLYISDEGQSCCETRYMTCDDSLSDLNGKTLAEINVKPGPETNGEYFEHEIAFLEIKTTDGTSVSFATHNEHNGYHGGFNLQVKAVKQ